MFLKIATLLAILGVLLSLVLRIVQQSLLVGRVYSYSMRYIFNALSIAEALSLTVPLLIFFVAFFLSLNSKTATNAVSK